MIEKWSDERSGTVCQRERRGGEQNEMSGEEVYWLHWVDYCGGWRLCVE